MFCAQTDFIFYFSIVEESEKEVLKEVEEAELKEIVSCPSIAGDDTYFRDYYIPPVTEEPGEEISEERYLFRRINKIHISHFIYNL